MTKPYDTQIAGTGIARLTNVGLALTAMKQIMAATPQMPRIAVFSGQPGLGKTQSALHMAHPLGGVNAAYVCLRPFETTRTLAQLILTEIDVRWKSGWTIAQMYDAICERLAQMNRPLVIDEVNYIAEKNSVDFIRAIHDQSATPIFLIGEADLQTKLLRHHERFHDRVLTWMYAAPCDVDDVGLLVKHYSPGLQWDAEALAALLNITGGIARKITTQIERVKEDARRKGLDKITADVVMSGSAITAAHKLAHGDGKGVRRVA